MMEFFVMVVKYGYTRFMMKRCIVHHVSPVNLDALFLTVKHGKLRLGKNHP
jgi:hypothetical protein